jgi:RecB family exonuclease
VDIVGLQDLLLERIARRPRGGLLDGVLVIVPTRRLATHLKRRMASRLRAALGVHIVTHRGLAIRALESALEVPPRALPETALASLLEACLESESGERDESDEGDARYLREHQGARSALLATFKDLREAGIDPDDISRVRLEPGDCPPFVRPLYARFVEALERLERDRWTDSAGLVRAAIPHVPDFLKLKGIRAAFHHGAYELIGVHLELLEAVASAVETEYLLPAEAEGPAFSYARRFADILRGRGARIAPAASVSERTREPWVARLRRLHDPEASFGVFEGPPSLEIQHAQGAQDELRAAALRALALHAREGIPLEEIVIVARSLEPYAPYLEATFEALGVPYATSARCPLAREGSVAAFLALLRVLARDFERSAFLSLLRSPRLVLPGLEMGALASEVDPWDRWSRSARIAEGLAAWRTLPRLIEEMRERDSADADLKDDDGVRSEARRRSAGKLSGIIEALASERDRWREAKTAEEHLAILRDLAARYISSELPEGRAGASWASPAGIPALMGAVRAALEAQAVGLEVGGRKEVLGGKEVGGKKRAGRSAPPRSISIDEVEALARSAAEAEELPLSEDDPAGLEVLDVMQARGLEHAAVIWLGFHDESFPRLARPDPHLSDAARMAFSSATGRPLAPKAAGAQDEERLLLAMGLASAREKFILSFQRSDDGGRKRARSSALREVARVFTGKADSRACLEDRTDNPWRPERISSHPGETEVQTARSPRLGLLLPSDALVAGAVAARDGTKAARLLLRGLSLDDEHRVAAVSCVEQIESFDPARADFDGATGMGIDPARTLSPTALERLGRCPLSFFLRDVLGLRELDEEAVPHRIESRVLGNAVHDTLADLCRKVRDEKLLSEEMAEEKAKARALEILREIWKKQLQAAAGPAYSRLRALFEVLGGRWLRSLEEFVARDLAEMRGLQPDGLLVEEKFAAKIKLPPGLTISAGGRLDRVIEAGGELWIDDYKTGAGLGKLKSRTHILRGLHLQLPLYREIVAAQRKLSPSRVKARLLGVGPASEETPQELDLDGEAREGFLETLRVAVRLAREGRFPLRRDSDDVSYCRWCAYSRTCRKTHEPTLSRLDADPRLADFRDLRRKADKKMYTLGQVRKKAAAGGEPAEEGGGS